MEFHLFAHENNPHYLQDLVFTRTGDTILIQVVDERNNEKARYEIDAAKFQKLCGLLDLEEF